MARTQKYKNIERNAVSAIGRGLRNVGILIKKGTLSLLHAVDLRITVMLVPHSQGKSISFETSAAAIVLGFILAIGVGVSCVYFVHGAASEQVQIARLTEQGRDTQARLDELRDANADLLQAAKRFRETLAQSISTLDKGSSASGVSLSGALGAKGLSGGEGDLSSLFNVKDALPYSVQETQDIKELTEFLDNACDPVEQFGKMFDSRAVLFREIPSIWPVANPNAHLSMVFGPNVHPITGQWYVHKGIDFSTFRSGDRVIATADGYVAVVGYDLSFGNYVIIRHKHGIYTRYAHMMYSTVKKGQYVSQRDLIGYVGNTGVTTGPHLHYEIHIGSDVVDPARYINVKVSK